MKEGEESVVLDRAGAAVEHVLFEACAPVDVFGLFNLPTVSAELTEHVVENECWGDW